MEARSLDFLKRLLAAPSPSGFEQPAQQVVREYVKEFADDVRTDVHGNIIAVRNPEAECRVMLAGHCDEIGLMVTHIDENGFAYFQPIGGVDPAVLAAQRVTLHGPDGDVPGVIGRKPIHLMEDDDRKRPAKIEDLWIDIGASKKADAEKAIHVGCHATLVAPFLELRNGLVASRGFDDKAGAFVAAEALRLADARKLRVGVYAVSTVQEEIGLRGARTSAYGIDPSVGIAVDVGFASDCPNIDKKKVGDVKLGKGPILHRGANMNPVLQKLIERTAKQRKIGFQLQAEPRATGTDANVMQLNRSGVAVTLMSVPNRYMHSGVEVVALKDLENAAKLLAATLAEIKPDMDFTP